MAETADAVAERYQRALATLVGKLEKDRTVVAALLWGSVAYDTVWEKSDIDLTIVLDEGSAGEWLTLTEEGISIHASLVPRSDFRKMLGGTLQGSFVDSTLARSKLLFCTDPALAAQYEERPRRLGDRDQRIQLLRAGTDALPPFDKARKWLAVKHDLDTTTQWILGTGVALARIEVFAAGDNPGREVLPQAMALNPTFFRTVHAGLLAGPRDRAHLAGVLAGIEDYLEERTDLCFAPVLDYLAEAGVPVGSREINQHFKRQMGMTGVDIACDWLVERGRLEKLGLPIRLARTSRVSVDEAAYAARLG
ncbi:MAG: nucleotidyltransferase domain-containing protein [Armatimonadota bacterium]